MFCFRPCWQGALGIPGPFDALQLCAVEELAAVFETKFSVGFDLATSETTHLNQGSSLTRRGTRNFSRRIRQTLFSNPTSRSLLHWMMRKLKMISGLLRKISFVAITWNPESTCTCRTKNHSLFHWNTLTLPELPIQLCMWCRRKILTITGTLMATENCRMHGQVSRDSLFKWEATWWIYMVQRETDEATNDLKTRQCVARCVEAYVWCIETQSKAKHGSSRNLNSIMPAWYLLQWSWRWRIQGQHEEGS